MSDNGVPIVGEDVEIKRPSCKETLLPNTATAEFETGHVAQIFYCNGCKAAISIQLIGQKPKPKSSILVARTGGRSLKQ